jgi:hypothetical protein
VAADAKSVVLTIDALRAGYVHEFKLTNLANQDGVPLLHEEVYYTLVNIPENLTL